MTLWTDYKNIVDGLSTAILMLDQTLRIQYLNPACEALFGVSARQVHNQLAADCIFQDPKDLDPIQDVLESQVGYIKREALLRFNRLRSVRADYSVSPIVDDDQNPKLLIEFRELDRIMRISKDDAQLHHQHTNRQLIRGIAHEVKNPLGGIRGAAQLLEMNFPDDIKEYTQVIIQETDRLCNLVDQMLGPNTTQKIEPLNIHEVLERVRTIILASAPATIVIERDYDVSLPDISGIKDQLIQSTLNIAQNAYQALTEDQTQTAPKIIFRTRVIRNFTIGGTRHRIAACIEIIDNGPGITEELQDAIFFPMISGRANGNGIGLSIAQSIVNQHHGLIEYDSEPGLTRFSIILPLE
ncbi:MAG: PAS domain-containing sensor histidine kinase [Gammaproteobacteria bacterium]|nr:MAG: PAS domain-containing sensor histidine kinase [Gammaproteobacteria bacterium]